jgi:IS30 family transposase
LPAGLIGLALDRPVGHPGRCGTCHETIYQAPYIQGRGELRREIAAALRSGRARRQERQPQPRFVVPMLMISDRPAEAADRSVPGHSEGDLIIGKDSASQIGTLVERASRYLPLVRLHRCPPRCRRRELNARPRKTLGWETPAERLANS